MPPARARRRPQEGQTRTRPASPRLRLVEEEAPPRSERRTVTITGNPGRLPRRRSPTQAQIVARPDRVALWAFLLGLFLVVVAAATAHAAPL